MKKGYIPNQHGAWAMLLIPFLFGMFAAKPNWVHGLLFLGWLLVYLFSFPFLQWIRTQKWQVYGKPMLLYGGLLIPVAVGLLLARPELWKWIPWFIPLFIVNCYYAKKKRERAFLNDLAAVIQFSLIVFVAYHVGGGDNWTLATELFGLSILYFTGTIFYVKTIIREKNNVAFYRFSIGYHVVSMAIALILFPPGILIPLFLLLLRAIWFPRTKITVKRSGMLEIAFSLIMAITALSVF
ncbi:YwiC-like family protein [Paenibacillus vini]|uniref:YwiC-like family protein n=1 Tax=Paenibacillus vini TaxID=1476024 RepID=UPI0025B6A077|nr:YwiC-like family protein [Paenibacillus vini]MDN4071100.1 YwiC-like family protein [Paenibacillus vini]